MINKNLIRVMPEYFDRYISHVPDIDLIEAFELYGAGFLMNEKDMLKQLGHTVYSPGKWTIRDIIQHLIDTERIFAYRALRIARDDKTVLPGYDENLFASKAHASGRKLEDLLSEFEFVRQSTSALFKSLYEEDLLREGFIFKSDISVVSIGYTIAGHVIHHMNVIRDKYYPLITL